MSVAKVPPTSCVSPAAVHIWLAPQDTPMRMLRPALGLLGVDRRVHAVPFQTSPSVLEKVWPLVCDCPTAVQEPAEVHDTPLRRLNWNPTGWAWTAGSTWPRPMPRRGSRTRCCPPLHTS